MNASADYVFSRRLLSNTLGRFHGEGFEHPDLVVRAGPRFWLSQARHLTPRGPFLGATAGYVGTYEERRSRHSLSLSAEAGWRVPLSRGRLMAMPRLLLTVTTPEWTPIVGAELLLSVHF